MIDLVSTFVGTFFDICLLIYYIKDRAVKVNKMVFFVCFISCTFINVLINILPFSFLIKCSPFLKKGHTCSVLKNYCFICAATSSAKFSSFFSIPSPVSKRTNFLIATVAPTSFDTSSRYLATVCFPSAAITYV